MDYDDSLTPSELMEILDALDSSTSSHNGADTETGFEANSVSVDDAQAGLLPARHKVSKGRRQRKRIRKVGSVPYSTDLQRRRKAELESLRLEVRELEDKLAQLHLQRVEGATSSIKNEREKWRQVADLANKELKYSEHTNRELKESLSSLLSTCSNIQELLTKGDVFEGKDFVFQDQVQSNQALDTTFMANFILGSMAKSMHEMYRQAGSVFPALVGNLSATLQSRKKRHKKLACMDYSYMEVISVTPMACTIAEAWKSLWEQLVRRKDTEPEKLYRFVRAKSNASLEMSFTLPLRDDTCKLLFVDAVSAYRKYDEENRVVLVGKTVWLFRAGGLELETLHWTIISPAPTNPLQASVVQSCNQLRVKNVNCMSANVVDTLLAEIGGKLRSFMSAVQNGLLRGAFAVG